MFILRDAARRVVYRRRTRSLTRNAASLGDPELRRRIDAVGDWFQNIDIKGTPTKLRSHAGEPLDYPRAGWERLRHSLPSLAGKSVLDIGCNAGFYSIECTRLGARRVVGVDISQGRPDNFIAQAEFAARELGLNIEYRTQDFNDVSDGPYDVVLFLGVLYHLDDPIAGLRRAAKLARETLVVATKATPRRGALLESKRGGWWGDPTCPWVPTRQLVDDMLMDSGFQRLVRPHVTTRRQYIVVAHR